MEDESRKPEREPYSREPYPFHRGGYVAGLALILIGIFFLAVQWVPGLRLWVSPERSWPLIVIGVAVLLAVIGLATGATDMAIPTFIVGGIGGLLYWQNATGNWESWSWAWTLIPGFVGVGLLAAGLFRVAQGRPSRGLFASGVWNIFSAAMLFAIFGSFLGGPSWLTRYWPLGIILLGLWVILRPGRRRWRDEWRNERRDRRGGGAA